MSRLQKWVNMTITGHDVRDDERFRKLPKAFQKLSVRLPFVVALGLGVGILGLTVSERYVMPHYQAYVISSAITQAHPSLKIIQDQFPEEFDKIQAIIEQRRGESMPPAIARRSIEEVVAAIQRRHGDTIGNASNESLRDVLINTADLYEGLAAQERHDLCVALLRSGSTRIGQSVPQDILDGIELQSESLFQALAEGRDSSEREMADRSDWSAHVIEALRADIPVVVIDSLAGGSSSIEDQILCDGAARFFRDLADRDDERSERVMRDVVRALTGARPIARDIPQTREI